MLYLDRWGVHSFFRKGWIWKHRSVDPILKGVYEMKHLRYRHGYICMWECIFHAWRKHRGYTAGMPQIRLTIEDTLEMKTEANNKNILSISKGL